MRSIKVTENLKNSNRQHLRDGAYGVKVKETNNLIFTPIRTRTPKNPIQQTLTGKVQTRGHTQLRVKSQEHNVTWLIPAKLGSIGLLGSTWLTTDRGTQQYDGKQKGSSS